MPSKPPPPWKFYAAGLVIYGLVALGAYGMGRLVSGYVLWRHTCPAASSALNSSSFTIYHPRHALTTGP